MGEQTFSFEVNIERLFKYSDLENLIRSDYGRRRNSPVFVAGGANCTFEAISDSSWIREGWQHIF